MPRVAVTICTYQTPPKMLHRAVHSVLNQTYSNFDLFVLSDGDDDGWDALLDNVEDSRFIPYEFPDNRGRYATEHNFLPHRRGDYELWAPLDSDDWAEPFWLDKLINRLDRDGADAAFGAHAIHRKGRQVPGIEQPQAWDGTRRARWFAHMSGVWNLDFVLDWNLTNPKYRVGWDSLMTAVPWVVGKVSLTNDVVVHREIRPGSLTQSKETGFNSPLRRRAAADVRGIFNAVVLHPDKTKEILDAARS